MNLKYTWIWVVLAGGLFAGIFFFHPHPNRPVAPIKVLPRLKPALVTSVQLRPLGQLEIRVERTNGGWQLTEPLVYPARAAGIERLLAALEKLTPATYITRRELENHAEADSGFGFDSPQATLIIKQGDYRSHLAFGSFTVPGDQVFLQVVGDEGVYVVDAELMKLIPRTANGWRDPTLLNLANLAFDRVSVTNGATFFEVQRDPTNKLWRMIRPMPARAYNAKIEESLESLQNLQVVQFVTDDPKADLEALGLQPPGLEIALAEGSNLVGVLQFGKSPTNDARQVYARQLGQQAIVTVANEVLAPWRAPANDFRDPHLVVMNAPISAIGVRAEDEFAVVFVTNGVWRVQPQDFPADAGLVKDLLLRLSEMQVVQFVKDVVTELDLPAYGLAAPPRTYSLKSPVTNAAGSLTNIILAELSFGTNREDKVFARRTDESFVYAVRQADLDRLPSASYHLRDRQIWNVSTNDIDRVTIRQNGKVRQLLRQAAYEWSLAPGSQGMIDNVLAIEETVRPLTQLSAEAWVARGAENRPRYALTNAGPQITLELKNGTNLTLELGGELPGALPCAAVTLEGDLWIFRLPFLLHRDVLAYLSIPAGTP